MVADTQLRQLDGLGETLSSYDSIDLPRDGRCAFHGIVCARMGHVRWGKLAQEAQIHMATELVWQCML